MNKELEALEDIILYLNANEPKGLYCKNIEIIKTALKEISGEDRVVLRHIKIGKLHPLTTKCYQDLLKKQRALEIIKRELNIDEILFSLKGVASAKDYDLVKEVLKNEKTF